MFNIFDECIKSGSFREGRRTTSKCVWVIKCSSPYVSSLSLNDRKHDMNSHPPSAPDQNINSCEGETPNVLYHYKCQKWWKYDVKSQNFQRMFSKF
jgi:hypothetical protein